MGSCGYCDLKGDQLGLSYDMIYDICMLISDFSISSHFVFGVLDLLVMQQYHTWSSDVGL